ncbi:ROK family protein [Curtobacterium pusillum]|uniref:ROK family transcriptional regulator n=1 Tax=Curtobacterium pusillum TaxID=69373 RepID=A0ABX2MBX8_9MICO|nr:ROK family transcriptional regulator [Curtobacterium pusillum]NUU15490.1 ROK family transcriptional regulator [Curtobacterium pusillum]GLK32791.1 transcriptional regulator [Curtobacterium pusillum]
MNHRHYQDVDHVHGSVGDVLRLIRVGDSTSRSTLARAIGLAPSTVGLRVDALVELGLVHEVGAEGSRGGRRARRLELDGDAGFVAATDLGANHTRIVLSDLAGRTLADTDHTDTSDPLPRADGPAAAVADLWRRFERLADAAGRSMADFRGAAIGVPAPIAYPSGRIVTPSFEPSWHDVALGSLFAQHTDAPVLVENDANLIALAERSDTEPAERSNLVAVKLGTRIGGGVIAGGRLHRGVGGAAGEVSHTAVEGSAAIGCTCGVPNCLESVASGGAIIARLRAAGHDIASTSDLLRLGAQGDAAVVEELREAGAMIGRVLAGIANFFNPREVVLAGAMSASPPLVAAIRSELYRMCLPLVADDLDVRASRVPRDAGIRGGIVLALDEVLAPARIDELARQATSVDDLQVRSA